MAYVLQAHSIPHDIDHDTANDFVPRRRIMITGIRRSSQTKLSTVVRRCSLEILFNPMLIFFDAHNFVLDVYGNDVENDLDEFYVNIVLGIQGFPYYNLIQT